MKLRVLDLFSGIGGISLGLESTGGFETIHFCELNPYCRKVLKKHWPLVPVTKDIRFLTKSFLKELGKIDLICGGFPCQDISVANITGEGLDGIDSGLWIEFRRIIQEVNPKWILIENVANLKSKGFATILQNLNELRFDVSWHNISATTVGRPHRRERIFIVANSQCIRLPERANQEHQTDSPNFSGDPDKQSASLANSDNRGMEVEGTYQDDKKKNQEWGIISARCGADNRGNSDTSEDGTISLAHTTGKGLEGAIGRPPEGKRPSFKSRIFPEWSPECDYERAIKSPIFGMAYGISQRLDEGGLIEQTPHDSELPKLVRGLPDRKERIQSLGNSVVPAIVSIIGEAILEANGKGAEDAPDSLILI